MFKTLRQWVVRCASMMLLRIDSDAVIGSVIDRCVRDGLDVEIRSPR